MKKLLLSLAWGTISCLPAHAAVVRVPLEFIDGTPAVSLTLNGKSTQFILDTGASLQLYLPKALAANISDLKPGPTQRTFDLRGALHESQGFTIDDFGLSGVNFGSVSGSYLVPTGFSVSGPNKFNDRFPVLGLTLFEHKALLLDFSGRKFVMADTLEELLPNGKAGWRPLPVERTRQGLMASFQGGRKQYRMALDSAGNMSVVKTDAVPPDEERGNCPMQINGQAHCQYIEVGVAGVDSITPIIVGLPAAFQADGVAGRDFFQKILLIYDGATGQVLLQNAAGNANAP
jgi:hypothetical protein